MIFRESFTKCKSMPWGFGSIPSCLFSWNMQFRPHGYGLARSQTRNLLKVIPNTTPNFLFFFFNSKLSWASLSAKKVKSSFLSSTNKCAYHPVCPLQSGMEWSVTALGQVISIFLWSVMGSTKPSLNSTGLVMHLLCAMHCATCWGCNTVQDTASVSLENIRSALGQTGRKR